MPRMLKSLFLIGLLFVNSLAWGSKESDDDSNFETIQRNYQQVEGGTLVTWVSQDKNSPNKQYTGKRFIPTSPTETETISLEMREHQTNAMPNNQPNRSSTSDSHPTQPQNPRNWIYNLFRVKVGPSNIPNNISSPNATAGTYAAHQASGMYTSGDRERARQKREDAQAWYKEEEERNNPTLPSLPHAFSEISLEELEAIKKNKKNLMLPASKLVAIKWECQKFLKKAKYKIPIIMSVQTLDVLNFLN